MTLPSHHLIPSSQFQHIGFMTLFMVVLAFFSSVATLSVYNITKGWMINTKDTLLIEIPSFDSSTKTLLDRQKIDSYIKNITEKLSDDPLITALKIQQDNDLKVGNDNRFSIPSPAFITINLSTERAKNAEQRLVDLINRNVPLANIQTPETWQIDIQKKALSLQILFLSLTLSIFLITAILLSAIIKTHIKANEDVINLIHLMGASPSIIAKLFVMSVTKPVLFGIFVSSLFCVLIAIAYNHFIPIDVLMSQLFICFFIVGTAFIFICRLITYWTVRSSLSNMP